MARIRRSKEVLLTFFQEEKLKEILDTFESKGDAKWKKGINLDA